MSKKNQSTSREASAYVVYVVDDDEAFRDWLARALDTIGLVTRGYQKPSDFLADFSAHDAGCVVLDVRLPEMSGQQLYDKLREMGVQTPVMMITACGEVPDAVAAIKAGAVDYVQKPLTEQALIDRVKRALSLSEERRELDDEHLRIRDRIELLSPRELQVLELLVKGKTTKQLSKELGVGLTTIDFHRHNLFEKMQVENVVELAHLMDFYKQQA